MPAHYLDKDGTYALPTSWGEVTTREFCDLDRMQLRTMEARASYFAGRPIQVNVKVANTLAFLLYEPPTDGGLPYPLDLGQETYLQVETIRAQIAARPTHEFLPSVFGVFTERVSSTTPDVFRQDRANRRAVASLGWPITDTYPAVRHCLSELGRLSEKYAALSEPDRTEAGQRARAAGSDRLDKYSHFNVAYAYSQKLNVSLGTVYQMPFDTIMFMLMHDRETAEINDQIQQNSKNAS